MRCAVKNCNNDNKSKACAISFFSFPTNAALQKQWINFCCRDKNMNPRTSNICMEHFKPDDFENSLEYEMGFTKRRFLKKSVVPSIKKTTSINAALSQERGNRIQKRENKKTVEMLLKECDVTSDLVYDEEICEPACEAEDPLLLIEECAEDIINFSKKCNENSEIERLKLELECLRKEIKDLKRDNKKQSAELKAIVEKGLSETQIHEYILNAIKTLETNRRKKF